MHANMNKLRRKQQRGSKPRCHWLTHGDRLVVAARLTKLIGPFGVVGKDDKWFPDGFDDTSEAQLHRQCGLLPSETCSALNDWWFACSGRAPTPNFDIASTCTVSFGNYVRKGLLLVEAKAHTHELDNESSGKKTQVNSSEASKRNHEQIGTCIRDANSALSTTHGSEWNLSRDDRYQMSNRFAWAWKLSDLGVPVVLVYLGFLRAAEMQDVSGSGQFFTHDDWTNCVMDHSKRLVPSGVWNVPQQAQGELMIPLIRSLDVNYDGPIS